MAKSKRRSLRVTGTVKASLTGGGKKTRHAKPKRKTRATRVSTSKKTATKKPAGPTVVEFSPAAKTQLDGLRASIDGFKVDLKTAITEGTAAVVSKLDGTAQLEKKQHDEDVAAAKKLHDDEVVAAQKLRDDVAAAAKKQHDEDVAAAKKQHDEDVAATKVIRDETARLAKIQRDEDARLDKEARNQEQAASEALAKSLKDNNHRPRWLFPVILGILLAILAALLWPIIFNKIVANTSGLTGQDVREALRDNSKEQREIDRKEKAVPGTPPATPQGTPQPATPATPPTATQPMVGLTGSEFLQGLEKIVDRSDKRFETFVKSLPSNGGPTTLLVATPEPKWTRNVCAFQINGCPATFFKAQEGSTRPVDGSPDVTELYDEKGVHQVFKGKYILGVEKYILGSEPIGPIVSFDEIDPTTGLRKNFRNRIRQSDVYSVPGGVRYMSTFSGDYEDQFYKGNVWLPPTNTPTGGIK